MKKGILFALIVLMSVLGVSAQTWTSAQTLTLNGATLTGDVTNIPVAVRINSTNCPNFTGSQADLRFVDASGNTLPLEVEKWNVSGTSVVWVLVPNIAANGSTTLEMCWGATGVSSISDGEAVFETANGFAGVWHLNESANAGEVIDATSNNNDCEGDAMENVTQGGDAVFGPGAEFDGDGYINISDNPAMYSDADMTASIWFKNTGTDGGILYKRGTSSPVWEAWGLYVMSSRGNLEYVYATADGETGWYDGSGQAGSNWFHVALVREGGNLYAYEGGSRSTLESGLTEATYDAWGEICIGSQADNEEFFTGLLDEVRVSTVARSANFIAVEVANGEGTLITYGSTGTPAHQPGATVSVRKTAIGEAGKMAIASSPNPFHKATHVTYRVPSAAKVKLSVYDMQGKLVKNLVNEYQSGQKSVKWDGTDSRGRLVSDGMYLVRLNAGSQTKQQRIVMMK